ncbi:hypothetical protein RRG08_047999 [Elysia crispata]|uniref:Uncharacterized protein n=1 Tax=Elysia crispata TaxID=231223 RepID=A0AAE0XRX3_9GAST|nr:hypothetical protein RRG08_047999 [Elysia crispata]
MYCRKAKLRLPLKSILEEYKCGKARLLSMLEDSEDPVVKAVHVQPTIKTDLAHGATSDQLFHQISVRSPALTRKSGTVGKERGPHLSAMTRQADHRACLELLQNRPLTGRHSRVLKELAAIISTAKGETTLPNTNALIFPTEGGAKSWHGRPMRTTNQIKCLLDGSDDYDVSADLPEWDSHPSIIKETRSRPDIVIHSASTQQLIMVELTVPYENRMEEAHIYKREKYQNLTKELENAGYKAVVMPVEVGARGFVGSSVYDLLT